MKSWGKIKSYTLLHPFAIWLRELCKNPAVGDFLGGDSGPQSRRLRPIKGGDFDSEPKTPAKESGLPNSVFHPSGASLCCPSRVFERLSGDSEVFAPGSRRLRSLQARDFG
jgi:hypothetical protein